MRICTSMKLPQLEGKIEDLSDLLERVRDELRDERERVRRIEDLLSGVEDDEE